MTEINFDAFDRELDEAQQYLLKPQESVKDRRGITASTLNMQTPVRAASPRMGSTGSRSRYSTPEEREKLISRLLNERKMRSSSSSQKYYARADEDEEEMQEKERSPSKVSEFYSGILGDSSVNHLDRDGESGEMLFFASDLIQSTSNEDVSDDSLDTSEVRERDRLTISNTLSNMETQRARHDNAYRPKSGVVWEIPANSSSTPLPSERLARYRPGSFDPQKTRDIPTRRSRSASSSRERSSSRAKAYSGHNSSHEKGHKPWRAGGNIPSRSISPGIPQDSVKSRRPLKSQSISPKSREQSTRYLKSRDEIQQEAVEQFKEEFTFKPKLVSERLSIGHRHRPDIKTRINEMYESHEKSLQSREKMKRDLERSELGECTFRPQISKGTTAIMRQKAALEQTSEGGPEPSSSAAADAADRLHKEAKQRATQQHIVKKVMDKMRRNQFSFQPTINPATSVIVGADDPDYKPIYKRVADVQRSQAENLHRIRADLEEESKTILTFAPDVDKKSRQLADKRINESYAGDLGLLNASVETRLMREGRAAMARKQELKQSRERELSEQMQQAKASKGSDIIVKSNQLLVQSSFEDRQRFYDKKQHESKANLKKREDSKEKDWFKPQVSEKSEVIIATKRPSLISETPTERAARLSHADQISREQRRKEVEHLVYGGLTFSPTIDPISKVLGRESDIGELYENKRGKHIKEQIRQKSEEEIGKQCSFKPKVIPYRPRYIPENNLDEDFSSRSGKYKCPVEAWGADDSHVDDPTKGTGYIQPTIDLRQPEKTLREIHRQQQEREDRRRSELAARELEELAQCTFHPQVPIYTPSPVDQPVVVRGIGRHLELMQLREKLQVERAMREEEVFGVRNPERFRKAENGATIVEPFQLSSYSLRKSKAVGELEAKERAELTFAPSINTQRKLGKEYVNHLIENSDHLSYTSNS